MAGLPMQGVKYKYDSHRKIIESEDDMRERNGHSPDYANALMLAYSDFAPETIKGVS
jgi:hypothetical protein